MEHVIYKTDSSDLVCHSKLDVIESVHRQEEDDVLMVEMLRQEARIAESLQVFRETCERFSTYWFGQDFAELSSCLTSFIQNAQCFGENRFLKILEDFEVIDTLVEIVDVGDPDRNPGLCNYSETDSCFLWRSISALQCICRYAQEIAVEHIFRIADMILRNFPLFSDTRTQIQSIILCQWLAENPAMAKKYAHEIAGLSITKLQSRDQHPTIEFHLIALLSTLARWEDLGASTTRLIFDGVCLILSRDKPHVMLYAICTLFYLIKNDMGLATSIPVDALLSSLICDQLEISFYLCEILKACLMLFDCERLEELLGIVNWRELCQLVDMDFRLGCCVIGLVHEGVVRGSRVVGIFLETGVFAKIVELGENIQFDVKVMVWKCLAQGFSNGNMRQVEEMISEGWHLLLLDALESFEQEFGKTVLKGLLKIADVVPSVLVEAGFVEVLDGLSSTSEKVNELISCLLSVLRASLLF
jgi:hypothetical protein